MTRITSTLVTLMLVTSLQIHPANAGCSCSKTVEVGLTLEMLKSHNAEYRSGPPTGSVAASDGTRDGTEEDEGLTQGAVVHSPLFSNRRKVPNARSQIAALSVPYTGRREPPGRAHGAQGVVQMDEIEEQSANQERSESCEPSLALQRSSSFPAPSAFSTGQSVEEYIRKRRA